MPGGSGARTWPADHQGLGYHKGWYACTMCKQQCTGAMELGLAGSPVAASQRLVGADDQNTLMVALNLGMALTDQGKHR